MTAGRPPKFTSPEEMEPLIEGYFLACDVAKKPYTVPGLALGLGFADRVSLFEYGQKPEFTNTIKAAKSRIEAQRAETLVERTTGSVTGLIFDLKNNFGWKDVQDHQVSGDVKHTIIINGLPPNGD